MVIRSQRPIYDRIAGKSPKYPHINFQWHVNVVWLPVQFIDSSDDDLYRLDFDPEGQGHQWENDLYIAGKIF